MSQIKNIVKHLLILVCVFANIAKVHAIEWNWVFPYPTFNDLYDIWGFSENNIFAVGHETIIHYDGEKWHFMLNESANSVWGSSENDVFAVGDGGKILHYDGEKWSTMLCKTSKNLNCVWGNSRNDVYTAGDFGTVFHYDGVSWKKMEIDTDKNLNCLWGFSENNVIVAGDSMSFFQYNGYYWSQMVFDEYIFVDQNINVKDIWGSSNNNIFAIARSFNDEHGLDDDGLILHYNGNFWDTHESIDPDYGSSNFIWGFSQDNVFVGCEKEIYHYNGEEWSSFFDYEKNLDSIWGVSGDSFFAVGEDGTVLAYQGDNNWKKYPEKAYDINSVWGNSTQEIYTVGDNGTILHYNHEQKQLTKMESGTESNLFDIWGSSKNNVFAVGSYGCLMHFDGNKWTKMDSGTNKNLLGIWGLEWNNVYAIGDDVILRFDGSQWSIVKNFNNYFLKWQDIWGSSEEDIYVVGYDIKFGIPYYGQILHYDGKKWSFVYEGAPVFDDIKCVWGSSDKNIFFVNSETVFHYNGNSITKMIDKSGDYSPGSFNKIWGMNENEVYAFGDIGMYCYNGIFWENISNSKNDRFDWVDMWANSDVTIAVPRTIGFGYSLHEHGEEGLVYNSRLRVCSNNCKYSSIQASINDAQDYETIWVEPGIYNESIDFFGKKIIVRSKQGSAKTIIRNRKDSSVVTFKSGESNFSILEGFTITHDKDKYGSGVHIISSSPIIRQCIISDNNFQIGGGIYCENASPIISNCTISYNTGKMGHGMYCESSSPIIVNSTIVQNFYPDGEAILMYNSSSLTVLNSIIWNNGYEIQVSGDCEVSIEYSNVMGGYWGKNNMNKNPIFFDEMNSDFHLKKNSPCINKGIEINLPKFDIDNEPVPMDNINDLGSDEVNHSPEAPIELSYAIENWSGRVYLNWKKHLDSEVLGYKIYRNNQYIGFSEKNEFVTQLVNMKCIYKITAIDKFNSESNYSNSIIINNKYWKIEYPDFSFCRKGLNDIWGLTDSFIIAVGNNGKIVQYDGTKWRHMNKISHEDLCCVWGKSENEVFAAGDMGTILHFNGKKWSIMPTGTNKSIKDIWGHSGNDVYAVGEKGLILHYNGVEWQINSHQTGHDLNCILVFSNTDVFVGGNNILLHYVNKKWVNMVFPRCPEENSVNGIWGTSENDVYIFTEYCVFHFDGDKWKQFFWFLGEGERLVHISGTSFKNLFAVGKSGKIYHYVDKNGSFEVIFNETTNGEAKSLWATDSDVFVVCKNGEIFHYNKNEWIVENKPKPPQTLTSIWGSSDSDIFAVGSERINYSTSNGIILHFDGKVWTKMSIPTDEPLFDIWGSSNSNIFSVGSSGTILHYDGKKWSKMDSKVEKFRYLSGIWGSSGINVFAVGNGIILHFDGEKWSRFDDTYISDWNSVWGTSSKNVFAVGDSYRTNHNNYYNIIYHFDGYEWTKSYNPHTHYPANLVDFKGIWGTSANNIFAVGDNSTILHYDGDEWSSLPFDEEFSLRDIWGSSKDNIFAVGENGLILHYDGNKWSRMVHVSTTGDLKGVWGSSKNNVIAVGDDIIRFSPANVCPDNCEYSNIQDAIDNSENHETILVDPGQYNEVINFNGKYIQVKSLKGPGSTIINGNQSKSTVIFNSGETNASILDGFMIINGSAQNGGGLQLINSSPTIKNCLIKGNVAKKNGG